jgi:hypothetical protein
MPEEMRQGMQDLIMKVGYLEETWALVQRQGRKALAADGITGPAAV